MVRLNSLMIHPAKKCSQCCRLDLINDKVQKKPSNPIVGLRHYPVPAPTHPLILEEKNPGYSSNSSTIQLDSTDFKARQRTEINFPCTTQRCDRLNFLSLLHNRIIRRPCTSLAPTNYKTLAMF